MARKLRRHQEDDHAKALIAWRNLYVARMPVLGLLFAIPNGGRRNAREAARLRAHGVRSGVSDYFLPVPKPHIAPQYSGLWIELKADDGRVSAPQDEWLKLMAAQGYRADVCYGWIEAARVICEYLGVMEFAP